MYLPWQHYKFLFLDSPFFRLFTKKIEIKKLYSFGGGWGYKKVLLKYNCVFLDPSNPGKSVLVGIVSRGKGCGQTGQTGGFIQYTVHLYTCTGLGFWIEKWIAVKLDKQVGSYSTLGTLVHLYRVRILSRGKDCGHSCQSDWLIQYTVHCTLEHCTGLGLWVEERVAVWLNNHVGSYSTLYTVHLYRVCIVGRGKGYGQTGQTGEFIQYTVQCTQYTCTGLVLWAERSDWTNR